MNVWLFLSVFFVLNLYCLLILCLIMKDPVAEYLIRFGEFLNSAVNVFRRTGGNRDRRNDEEGDQAQAEENILERVVTPPTLAEPSEANPLPSCSSFNLERVELGFGMEAEVGPGEPVLGLGVINGDPNADFSREEIKKK